LTNLVKYILFSFFADKCTGSIHILRIAVHADEFKIYLSRELNVHKNTIQGTQKSLGLLGTTA
jgi:hypothetical protein